MSPPMTPKTCKFKSNPSKPTHPVPFHCIWTSDLQLSCNGRLAKLIIIGGDLIRQLHIEQYLVEEKNTWSGENQPSWQYTRRTIHRNVWTEQLHILSKQIPFSRLFSKDLKSSRLVSSRQRWWNSTANPMPKADSTERLTRRSSTASLT